MSGGATNAPPLYTISLEGACPSSFAQAFPLYKGLRCLNLPSAAKLTSPEAYDWGKVMGGVLLLWCTAHVLSLGFIRYD